MGEFEVAEKMYLRALAIDEKYFGAEHTEIASLLNSLGLLYYTKGDYSRVEPIYNRALAIWEATVGIDDVRWARSLSNRATYLAAMGRGSESVQAHERALAALEARLGGSHPDVREVQAELGQACVETGKYARARSVLLRALERAPATVDPAHRATLLVSVSPLPITTVGCELASESGVPHIRQKFSVSSV